MVRFSVIQTVALHAMLLQLPAKSDAYNVVGLWNSAMMIMLTLHSFSASPLSRIYLPSELDVSSIKDLTSEHIYYITAKCLTAIDPDRKIPSVCIPPVWLQC